MLPGLKTPDGALYVTNQSPAATDVQSGGVTMTADGWVHVNGNTPQRFDQGKGFMNNGDLCIDQLGGAIVGYVGGLPVTATGALKCQLNQPVSPGDAYVGGLRVGPLGGLYIVDSAPAWTPAQLFAAGEEGAWYDPSDLSTLFQDSAGTTPVTADGQPVGLILDKRKASTSRTSLPVMTCSATVSQVGNVLTFSSSPAGDNASGAPPIVVTYFYRMSFTVSGTGSVVIYVGAVPVTFSAGTHTLKPWYASGSSFFIFRADTGGFNGTVTFSELVEYSGNHASQATAAARPLYKTDGTYHWLQFDGVDDSLSTGNIDFTSTDKISVFAGIHKNTNSVGIVSELSANGAAHQGAFYVVSGTDGGGEYTFAARGSNFSIAKVFAYVAPDTAVLACISNIPADLNQISRNTVAGQSGTSDLGAVNFGNYPLYIGRRAESYLPLNGKIYSLIVRGALSTAQEITDTETWVNGKTGAY